MKPKVLTLGAAIAREHRDGGQVKLSTFIPLKIRKRGGSKVVVRPDGQVDAPGKVTSPIDKPLLVALTRAFNRGSSARGVSQRCAQPVDTRVGRPRRPAGNAGGSGNRPVGWRTTAVRRPAGSLVAGR